MCLMEHQRVPKTTVTRGTLLSPQKCKIALCTPSQLEMKPISTSLAKSLSGVPHHREEVA